MHLTDASESCPAPGHPELFGGTFILATLLTALGQSQVVTIVIAVLCLALAFVFALFEAALQQHSRIRLTTEANRQNLTGAIDAALLREDEILFATKMGRGAMQVLGVATLVVVLVRAQLGTPAAIGWSLGIAMLFLVLNVATPHILGRRAGHLILLRGLIPYSRAIVVLRPVAVIVQLVGSRLTGGMRKAVDPSDEITDEILSKVEEGTREGTLEASAKQMIEGVMDLRESTAEQIMTPRTEMVCLPATATVQEAIERSQERGLSRLPVYKETPDDILGVLFMKDLLPHLASGRTPAIETLVHKPVFVPQSKNVGDLLREMQARQVHMAIVVDEYGGTDGVVTIEDILEEIVGEIADEHEGRARSDVVKLADNSATVEGKTHIDDLNEALDLEVPESEEYETVGGLLFSRMGRVPARGEHYELDNVKFTIIEADERRINRVKVTVDRDAG